MCEKDVSPPGSTLRRSPTLGPWTYVCVIVCSLVMKCKQYLNKGSSTIAEINQSQESRVKAHEERGQQLQVSMDLVSNGITVNYITHVDI